MERLPARRARLKRQRARSECMRRPRVAQTMLVMDGKRFGRFAQQARRTAGQLHELLPRDRRIRELALAPADHRVRVKRIQPCALVARKRVRPVEAGRAGEAGASPRHDPGPLVQAAESNGGPSSTSCAARAVKYASDS